MSEIVHVRNRTYEVTRESERARWAERELATGDTRYVTDEQIERYQIVTAPDGRPLIYGELSEGERTVGLFGRGEPS